MKLLVKAVLTLTFCLGVAVAHASSVVVNVIGATQVGFEASHLLRDGCPGPCGILVGQNSPLELTPASTSSGADQTYLISTYVGWNVTIVAPTSVGGRVFSHWIGCDNDGSTGSCTVLTSGGARSVFAVYGANPPSVLPPPFSLALRKLYVNALGTLNVPIASNTGHSGTSDYSLSLAPGTPVNLTAPLTHNELTFSHWTGCDASSGTPISNLCSVTMKAATTYCESTDSSLCPADRRATAVYTNASVRLTNISTRAMVKTDDDVLIAGFIVSGGAKRLLIKAEGPTLSASGVQPVLQDPTITLYSGATPIAANDNWGSNANASEIAASGLAPRYPSESALLVNLDPGAYTVIVQGVNRSTGIALVVVNDLDSTHTAGRLTNISSRAWVGLGDEQAIAGFIISGGSKKFLALGTGPSMAQYNLPGLLRNPKITLFSDSGGVLGSNDDWRNSNNAGQIDLQAGTSLTVRESAMYETLGPGAYTIILSGYYTDYSGIGLISVDE